MFFSRASHFALLTLLTLSAPQSIDPNSVDMKTRQTWCTNQKASCPLLCTQISSSASTAANTCDATSLAFNCVCSNGQVPNAANFSQTIPYYQCQTANQQCAARCGGSNPGCVTGCNAHPCGAQNPTRINATGSTSASGASATGTASGTASGSAGAAAQTPDSTGGFAGAPAQTSSSAAANLLQPGALTFRTAERYGLAVVFAGLFAGFTLFL